ncbi:MAG: hypothetical protein HYV26_10935, partial [Candidatus Hydrogenedentes bacterium]|nr:hypothetical protein [Candidatus Hydrogenedentota bacterium]
MCLSGNQRTYCLFGLAVFLAGSRSLSAAVLFSAEEGMVNLTPHVQLLPDPGGRLSVDEANAQLKTLPVYGQPVAHLGLMFEPVWLRVVVNNTDTRSTKVLVIQNPRLEDVRLYL